MDLDSGLLSNWASLEKSFECKLSNSVKTKEKVGCCLIPSGN